MELTGKQILKYTFLPGFLPRLKALFGEGFFHVACLVAQIFGSLGLLKPDSAYLRPQNFSSYNLGNVLAEASKNLEYSWKNIDRIIIFYCVIAGLVILALQIIILFLSLLAPSALAQTAGGVSATTAVIPSLKTWFLTSSVDPDYDLTFILLDKIFGMQDIFNSCISTAAPCFDYRGEPTSNMTATYPYPIHKALHGLFSFYSYGLFFIATIIILYYVTTLVGETAATGQPFGSRMNKTWTVPRLIVFFALLMPLNAGDRNAGLNAAQLITMHVAKYGSNFATNAWDRFNNVLTKSHLGEVETLIAKPNAPEVGGLAQFMYTARTCAIAEAIAYRHNVDAYIVRSNFFQSTQKDDRLGKITDKLKELNRQTGGGADTASEIDSLGSQLLNGNPEDNRTNSRISDLRQKLLDQNGDGSNYANDSNEKEAWAARQQDIIQQTGNLAIETRTNNKDAIDELNEEYALDEDINEALRTGNAIKLADAFYPVAQVFSNYGDIQLVFGVRDEKKYGHKTGYVSPLCGEMDIAVTDASEESSKFIQENYFVILQYLWTDSDMALSAKCLIRKTSPWHRASEDSQNADPDCTDLPDEEFFEEYRQTIEDTAFDNIEDAIETQIEEGDWTVDPALMAKGWAGAALWYNRIAEMNGALTTAIFNFPRPKSYPYVMEHVASQRKRFDVDPSPDKRFDPAFGDGRTPDFERNKDAAMANVLNTAYTLAQKGTKSTQAENIVSGNAFIDTVNAIFGTSGIMDMRNNTDVHPLAQLSSIGRGMIEATVRNAMVAFAGTVGGGLGSIVEPFIGQMGSNVAGVMKSLIMASLALGFTLFYAVPMMPFVYFLFAVSGWIKSIFEAMVAMPLWALSHIHIDGDGLPGKNASNGYYLLLEILLRPIMILFGLLASITIFAAMVSLLNEVFDMVVDNTGGFNAREIRESKEFDAANIQSYRGPVDQFFFSGMYVIICYMMGVASFKLIDQIPQQILRWMGFGTEAFQEGAGDPAGKLTSTSFSGTQKLGFALQRIAGDKGVNVAELAI